MLSSNKPQGSAATAGQIAALTGAETVTIKLANGATVTMTLDQLKDFLTA